MLMKSRFTLDFAERPVGLVAMTISFFGAVWAGDANLGRGVGCKAGARASRTRSRSAALVNVIDAVFVLAEGREVVNVVLVVQSDLLLLVLGLSGSNDF